MIGPKRGKKGSYPVYVWRDGKKKYVGSRDTYKEAQALEAAEKLKTHNARVAGASVQAFAERWVRDEEWRVSSSKGVARNENTMRHNASMLKQVVAWFGAEPLDSVKKHEAKRFAVKHPHAAKVAAAMYADAIDAEIIDCRNPFKGLGIAKSRGRKDITPLTEAEIDGLVETAKGLFGGYGEHFGAFILFQAYIGNRPAEGFAIEPGDIDLQSGTVRIEKQLQFNGLTETKNYLKRTVVLPVRVRESIVRFIDTDGPLKVPGRLPDGARDIYDPLFRTVDGKGLTKGTQGYYWRQVRAAWTNALPVSHWLRQRIAADPRKTLDIYECRHFCGSMLADRGVDVRDIAYQLGHSVATCEEYYLHGYEDRQIARLRDAFERPVSGARTGAGRANLA